MSLNRMPVYRTINQLVADIKEKDPNSAITAYYVRQISEDGKIITRKANSKILVNVDSFLEYMNKYDEE